MSCSTSPRGSRATLTTSPPPCTADSRSPWRRRGASRCVASASRRPGSRSPSSRSARAARTRCEPPSPHPPCPHARPPARRPQRPLLATAIMTSDAGLLRDGDGDELHQPYRLPLLPGSGRADRDRLRARCRRRCLSGAATTVLAICDSRRRRPRRREGLERRRRPRLRSPRATRLDNAFDTVAGSARRRRPTGRLRWSRTPWPARDAHRRVEEPRRTAPLQRRRPDDQRRSAHRDRRAERRGARRPCSSSSPATRWPTRGRSPARGTPSSATCARRWPRAGAERARRGARRRRRGERHRAADAPHRDRAGGGRGRRPSSPS